MAEKSPWNPSRSATRRVKNSLPKPTVCPNCNGEVYTAHHEDVYNGRSFGDWPWLYLCEQCDSYVGMHPFTNIPLGTLANATTREARSRCKAPFQALYRDGHMSRAEAYRALAKALGIPEAQCHFGWFDVAMCERAEKEAKKLLHSR